MVERKPQRQPASIFCPTDDLCERGSLDDWCGTMRATVLAEFERRAIKVPAPIDPLARSLDTPCWEGIGSAHQKGYRQLSIGARMRRAHRVALAAVWRLTDKDHVDHLCRNRACVNPDHLEAVTVVENTLRGASPSALHARQTHCLRGHDLTDPANVYISGGRRHCRACRSQRVRPSDQSGTSQANPAAGSVRQEPSNSTEHTNPARSES